MNYEQGILNSCCLVHKICLVHNIVHSFVPFLERMERKMVRLYSLLNEIHSNKFIITKLIVSQL